MGDEVNVIFHIAPDIFYEGIVTEVGVTAAKATAYPVTVLLKRRSPNLRSGMAAKVVFYKDEPTETFLATIDSTAGLLIEASFSVHEIFNSGSLVKIQKMHEELNAIRAKNVV